MSVSGAPHAEPGVQPVLRGSGVRSQAARALVDLTKPSINLMVLVTTAGGLWLAPTRPSVSRVIAALLGTCFVVGAANTLNCYLERDIDAHMTRTQNRPLPAGRISARAALIWGLVLAAIALPLLYVRVNPLTAGLALLALVSYVWVYTPMKQRSAYALWVGAVPGAMPPLMGWTAAQGKLEAPGIVLFLILFFWQLPHFLAIASFRQAEYTKAKIIVYPAIFGTKRAMLSGMLHAGILIPVSLALVPMGVLSWVYAAIALAVGVWFTYVCVRSVRHHDEVGWQKRVFFASLAYLPLLMTAIIVDIVARSL